MNLQNIKRLRKKNWPLPDQDVTVVFINSEVSCMFYLVLTIPRERMLMRLKPLKEIAKTMEVRRRPVRDMEEARRWHNLMMNCLNNGMRRLSHESKGVKAHSLELRGDTAQIDAI
ncbi:hypothetical protein BCON_0155g00260 [Botryotinia convoluta]|uniref:Uncharacterized protein n=1 Tax=Botryotinia convoluta TaxID=54673 RepID=A0A4Z1HS89_9HELO|nr:hypothetical protein BCON_0155g00260 [Botryotinia convoluta]